MDVRWVVGRQHRRFVELIAVTEELERTGRGKVGVQPQPVQNDLRGGWDQRAVSGINGTYEWPAVHGSSSLSEAIEERKGVGLLVDVGAGGNAAVVEMGARGHHLGCYIPTAMKYICL